MSIAWCWRDWQPVSQTHFFFFSGNSESFSQTHWSQVWPRSLFWSMGGHQKWQAVLPKQALKTLPDNVRFPPPREIQIITTVSLTVAEPQGGRDLGPWLSLGGELHAHEEHPFSFYLSEKLTSIFESFWDLGLFVIVANFLFYKLGYQ